MTKDFSLGDLKAKFDAISSSAGGASYTKVIMDLLMGNFTVQSYNDIVPYFNKEFISKISDNLKIDQNIQLETLLEEVTAHKKIIAVMSANQRTMDPNKITKTMMEEILALLLVNNKEATITNVEDFIKLIVSIRQNGPKLMTIMQDPSMISKFQKGDVSSILNIFSTINNKS